MIYNNFNGQNSVATSANEKEMKTVVVFNENGTVDYAFNISKNSIDGFMAVSRDQDDSYNNDVDAVYYEMENEYLKDRDNFITITTIEDEDFGDVEIKWNGNLDVIKADGLGITNVPKSFSIDRIMKAWDVFKHHYSDYGVMCLNYEQIDSIENEMEA